MAEDPWIAWSQIQMDDGKNLEPGDKVTKKLFSDEDWEQLVEAQAIRQRKFPELPANYTGSPRDYVLAKHREQLDEAEALYELSGSGLADENETLEEDVSSDDDEEDELNPLIDPITDKQMIDEHGDLLWLDQDGKTVAIPPQGDEE